jgi:NADPH:quinone reductase-like Zn-dependent oxidoreductase
MKAIVWTAYGPPDVLRLQEVETPTPQENQVRIKIHATTVTAGDCEMRSLKLPFGLGLPLRFYAGLRRPKRLTILGQELAGEVESVGAGVTRFKAGDPVFAGTGFEMGAYAEYVCMDQEPKDGALALKPANMSYEEAAAVPTGGLEAIYFLGKAEVQPGERVLVNGAGGSIGTVGVQLAKSYGAHVTAVDSGAKLEMLRAIGADVVIDYAQQDFSRSGECYDVILDVVGKSSPRRCLRALAPNGRYVVANPKLAHLVRKLGKTADGKTLILGSAPRTTQELDRLRTLIEAGKLRSVIDRRFPLEQVAEAHRYVETGQKQGNVVITVHATGP